MDDGKQPRRERWLALAAWGAFQLGLPLAVGVVDLDISGLVVLIVVLAPTVALAWYWPSPWLVLAPVALVLPFGWLAYHSGCDGCSQESTLGELYLLALVFWITPTIITMLVVFGLKASVNRTGAKTKPGQDAG